MKREYPGSDILFFGADVEEQRIIYRNMWITSTILGILLLGILPIMLGDRLWNEINKAHQDILSETAGRYLFGTMVMWSVFQIIAVPMIFAKASFSMVVVLWGLSIFAILLLQSAWKIKKKGHFYPYNRHIRKYGNKHHREQSDVACFVLMCAVVLYQCMMCTVGTHSDEDDSRFVVNALEAFDHDSMLLINPATGDYVGTWVGELTKEVASPWTIYIALVAKILNMHPTIVAHTVLPGILVAMAYAVYWLIAGEIYKKNVTYRCLFVMVAAFANLFFTNSNQTQAVFLLTRGWQGKAVVAGIMIPFLCYLMMRLYHADKEKQIYHLLLVSDIACCLMSGMGIFFSGVLIGILGLYITIIKKNAKILLRLAFTCIPTILFGMIYVLIG